jgi:hypothetical protein
VIDDANVVGHDILETHGGEVMLVDILPGFSTHAGGKGYSGEGTSGRKPIGGALLSSDRAVGSTPLSIIKALSP